MHDTSEMPDTPVDGASLSAMIEAEACRMFTLPDRWLGEALVRMSRALREELPHILGNRMEIGNPAHDVVWNLGPEAAARLGVSRFLYGERAGPGVTAMSDADLREAICAALESGALRALRTPFTGNGRTSPVSSDLMGRAVAKGNPLAFAAERLCPAPEPDGRHAPDHVSWCVEQKCLAGGHGIAWAWTPELLQDGPLSAPAFR